MANNTKRTPIGARIVYYRKRANLTQEQLADMIKIKRDTFARYETKNIPSINTLTRICEALNIKIEQLTNDDVDYTKQINSAPKTVKVLLKTNIPYNTDTYDYEYTDDGLAEITETECELIKKFRNLPPDKQKEILNIININQQ